MFETPKASILYLIFLIWTFLQHPVETISYDLEYAYSDDHPYIRRMFVKVWLFRILSSLFAWTLAKSIARHTTPLPIRLITEMYLYLAFFVLLIKIIHYWTTLPEFSYENHEVGYKWTGEFTIKFTKLHKFVIYNEILYFVYIGVM